MRVFISSPLFSKPWLMKYILFMLCLFMASIADCQTIKMKITSITDAAGEDIIAFEASDTLLISSGGGGGGSGTTRIEVVKIKKARGTSTNELFKRTMNANHFADVTFEFNDAGGSLYYKIVIKDVTVNHFSFLSPECTNCSKLLHQVWFGFTKIEWTDVATGNTTRYDLTTKAFY